MRSSLLLLSHSALEHVSHEHIQTSGASCRARKTLRYAAYPPILSGEAASSTVWACSSAMNQSPFRTSAYIYVPARGRFPCLEQGSSHTCILMFVPSADQTAATTGGGTENLSLNMMKIILQMCLTTLNVVCWLVPMKIRSFVESKRAISMANAFSGGVFLSLAFGESQTKEHGGKQTNKQTKRGYEETKSEARAKKSIKTGWPHAACPVHVQVSASPTAARSVNVIFVTYCRGGVSNVAQRYHLVWCY